MAGRKRSKPKKTRKQKQLDNVMKLEVMSNKKPSDKALEWMRRKPYYTTSKSEEE